MDRYEQRYGKYCYFLFAKAASQFNGNCTQSKMLATQEVE